MQNGPARRDRQTLDQPTQDLVLVYRDALRIGEKHGHRKAALEAVKKLPYIGNASNAEIKVLAEKQFSEFAAGLVASVEHASQIGKALDHLPVRSEQGDALREVEEALEQLRIVLGRKWHLIKPLVEIDTAENLAKLLREGAVKQLLPRPVRSEFVEQQAKPSKFGHRDLILSYLLKTQQQILMRMVKGGKTILRQARNKIFSGAPMKAPLEVALIMQLADHYEWALQKKASATVRGPFSQFCEDVFVAVGLTSVYEWDRLLKNGLKLYRRSPAVRRRQTQSAEAQSAENSRRKRKPRKQKLAGSTKRKITK